MKNSTRQFTSQAILHARTSPRASVSVSEPLRERSLIATALAGVLALTYLGTAQAGDFSPESRMMRPLYAVSFEVGDHHVLSYFLSKRKQCDLTVMVTERPKEAPRGKEIPPLDSTRFSAAIEGGETARVDTAQGRALEYSCARGAKLMSVREVSQIAANSPSEK